jgi:hypothetical protein
MADDALTGEQRATFDERGWLRLEGVFPREVALQMQDRMWAELREVAAIDRARRETWHQPRSSLRGAKRDPLQHAIGSDALLAAIGALLGPVRWRVPSNWGVVLITFPTGAAHRWTVPTNGWHYDFDLVQNAAAPRGLLVFTFLGSVVARGGGTLVVEGSHRLAARFASSLSPEDRARDHQTLRRRFLRHDPWLRALTGHGPQPVDRVAHFLGAAHVADGIPLRVAELIGEPGDAILCHPLLLHVASHDVADAPRFMRSQRICGEEPGRRRRGPGGAGQVQGSGVVPSQ